MTSRLWAMNVTTVVDAEPVPAGGMPAGQGTVITALAPPPSRSVPNPARRTVLWHGGPLPEGLVHAVLGQGWQSQHVSSAEVLAKTCLQDARGLVIEVSEGGSVKPPARDQTDVQAATAALVPLIELALTYGVPVAVVMGPDHGALDDLSLRVQRFVELTTPLLREGEPRVTYTLRQWDRLIMWLDQWAPGPPASPHLRLEGDMPTTMEYEAEVLLRRAFYDAEIVTLERIAGGKSGAAVWSAVTHTVSGAYRASPFLVKYNALTKTRTERSRYEQYANDLVSFRLRPPLHPTRSVEGLMHGLLVFDFIDRAIAFGTALTTYAPGQLIGSLFGHTLEGCLRHAREVVAPLPRAFSRIKALHWSAACEDAATLAQVGAPSLPAMLELRAQVDSMTAVPHRIATAHGDLHTGNLLVAAGSSDVLLIDYGSIDSMPVVTDPACLEVSITFAPADMRESLGLRMSPFHDAAWLRRAYQYPLEAFAVPPKFGRHAWVAEAVRAIRGATRQLESNPVAYAVAVASYLIRYASYTDNGALEDRALAYELAATLMRDATVAAVSAGGRDHVSDGAFDDPVPGQSCAVNTTGVERHA